MTRDEYDKYKSRLSIVEQEENQAKEWRRVLKQLINRGSANINIINIRGCKLNARIFAVIEEFETECQEKQNDILAEIGFNS